MALSLPLPRFLTSPRPVASDRGIEAPAAAGGLDEQDRIAIERRLERLYRTGMSPGVAFALRRHGELVFNRAYGEADREQGRALTVDTPICLFSASKAVTAILIHQLAAEGQLDLYQRVSHYLPEYGRNGKHRTTLMQVLMHRAGIPRISGDASAEDLFDDGRILQLMCDAEAHRPGRLQSYHAITGGFVLGEVIRRVTGDSPNVLLDRVIRQPLGMRYFRYGDDGAGVPAARNYATGIPLRGVDYFLTHAVGAGLAEVIDASNDPRFQQVVIPAGNLYATAEEACRFFQLLLDGGRYQGRQVLRPDVVRLATTRTGRGSQFDRTLMLPLEFSPGFMLGARGPNIFGLGTPHAFGHLGFISIYCWADPDRALSAALLTTGKCVAGPLVPAVMAFQHDLNRRTAGRRQ